MATQLYNCGGDCPELVISVLDEFNGIMIHLYTQDFGFVGSGCLNIKQYTRTHALKHGLHDEIRYLNMFYKG